jgi:hypothetical protein
MNLRQQHSIRLQMFFLVILASLPLIALLIYGWLR